VKKYLVRLLRKCNQIAKTRKPLTLIHMDNVRVHIARSTQEKLDISRFKCTRQPPYSPDIAPSDFFVWLETQLERREYDGENEFCEGVDEILISPSIKMIETLFVGWMNRLQSLIDRKDGYIS
jgi:hypothetical protein